jgi:DNA-binding transcriptional ArsR family regulator
LSTKSESARGGPADRTPDAGLWALVESLTDPFRGKLFTVIAEAKEDVSVRQLAQMLGEPVRKVRYHLDALVDRELVGIARETRRRGVIERGYRAEVVPVISTEQYGELEESQSRKIALLAVGFVLADLKAVAAAGMLGERLGHAEIRVPGEVDRQGWMELAAVQDQAYAQVQEVLSRSAERLAGSHEQPISSVSVQLLYEVPR